MKKLITLLSFSLITSFCIGQGTWSQKMTCQGSARYRAIAFAVNGKCYMGTGSTGGGISQNLKDLWEFDPVLNTWSQKADLIGRARTNGTASSTASYGYVGLGSDNGTLLNDWWQYNPVNNSWLSKTPFPGIKRFGAEAFSLQNLVYAGGGLDSANQVQNDFYSYDETNNSWTLKEPLPIGVSSAATFTIGQKGYFVSGATNGSVTCVTQTIEYDPVADSWTTKAPYAAGNTFSAIGFSLFDYGYVGTGFTGNLTDVMWRFDPVLNNWTQETSWPTGIRQWAVSCVTSNRAFVGTGNSTAGALFSDWWEFIPGIINVNNIQGINSAVDASFNHDTQEIIVKNVQNNGTIKIYNLEGKLIFEHFINAGDQSFPWYQDGIFIIALYDNQKISTAKIVCNN